MAGVLLTGLIFISPVPCVLASECLKVQGDSPCYLNEEFCFIVRKTIFNCSSGTEYHCGRDPGSKKFREACAEPVQCGAGKEPWIIPSSSGYKVECNYCHDHKDFYNPYDSRWSNEYSQCDVPKDECSSQDNKYECDVEDETDLCTKNVRCRCDVRNGYRIDKLYNENENACSYEHGYSCIEASWFPSQEVLLLGYICGPPCPPGYQRDRQDTDQCFPISATAPRPEISVPPSVTPKVTGSITTTTESTVQQSSPDKKKIFLIIAGLTLVYLLLFLQVSLIWFMLLRRGSPEDRKYCLAVAALMLVSQLVAISLVMYKDSPDTRKLLWTVIFITSEFLLLFMCAGLWMKFRQLTRAKSRLQRKTEEEKEMQQQRTVDEQGSSKASCNKQAGRY